MEPFMDKRQGWCSHRQWDSLLIPKESFHGLTEHNGFCDTSNKHIWTTNYSGSDQRPKPSESQTWCFFQSGSLSAQNILWSVIAPCWWVLYQWPPFRCQKTCDKYFSVAWFLQMPGVTSLGTDFFPSTCRIFPSSLLSNFNNKDFALSIKSLHYKSHISFIPGIDGKKTPNFSGEELLHGF